MDHCFQCLRSQREEGDERHEASILNYYLLNLFQCACNFHVHATCKLIYIVIAYKEQDLLLTSLKEGKLFHSQFV